MPKTVQRRDVQAVLKKTIAAFDSLLRKAPPFVISRDSLQLLMSELGARLEESWRKENETRLLSGWNRDVDKFRQAWLRAAGRNPRVMVNGQQVLLINEGATHVALRLCPKGPQDLGE